MKLTEKEARILACMELRADLPIAKAAKETGYPQHTIRYHLASLENRGVIRRAPFVNIVPAGYACYGVYFSCRTQAKEVNTFLQQLQNIRKVIWVAEMGGDFQYGFAVCVREVYEMQDFLKRLSERFPNMFFEKSIACQFAATPLPRRYLCSKRFDYPELSVCSTGKAIVLDETDHRVLSGLTRLRYNSLRQLAQLLQMPLSTLDDRVKKLEQRRVVLGYMYDVNCALYDVQAYTLLLYAKGLQPGFTEALRKYAAEHPNVVYLYECLGSWDFEFNVEVKSGQEVTRIVQDLQERFGPCLNTIKVLTRFRDLKISFVPY